MVMQVVRLDDGTRAKLWCTVCAAETYVPILHGGAPTSVEQVIETLEDAIRGHDRRCS